MNLKRIRISRIRTRRIWDIILIREIGIILELSIWWRIGSREIRCLSRINKGRISLELITKRKTKVETRPPQTKRNPLPKESVQTPTWRKRKIKNPKSQPKNKQEIKLIFHQDQKHPRKSSLKRALAIAAKAWRLRRASLMEVTMSDFKNTLIIWFNFLIYNFTILIFYNFADFLLTHLNL